MILETADSFKEVSGREIKKVPALRGDGGESLLRAQHQNAHVVRVGGETAERRCHQFFPLVQQRRERGNVAGYGTEYRSHAGGHHRPAASVGRRGRDPRVGVKSSVINAGDGWHEHPTQALLDLYTIRERGLAFEGLRVAIVGDVAHSRVARSNIFALTKLGAEMRVVGPPTMIPLQLEKLGVRVYHNLDEALRGVQVIMMLRLQLERQGRALFPTIREYARLYGLTAERVKLAEPGAIVMHPGPINRGVEIAPDVADSLSSVILDQVANGVAVRMGILYLMSGAN